MTLLINAIPSVSRTLSNTLLQRAFRPPAALRQCAPLRTLCSNSSQSRSPPRHTPDRHDRIRIPRDALTRYPNPTTFGALRLLDYVGTASFAFSGSMLAATAGMDLLGATLVGTVTAVGGGTIRDAVILNSPPFWTEEVEYLYISFLVASSTFFYVLRTRSQQRTLADSESAPAVAVDALGVGAFCVIGAMAAMRKRLPPLVCVIAGMSTATFGGAVRDVLCRRHIRILHSSAEIYASTAAAGAATYVAMCHVPAPPFVRVGAGVACAVALRAWAWTCGVRLPVCPTDLYDLHDAKL